MEKLIPEFIYENYQKRNFKGEFYGISMFMDISGFTSMTEHLMKYGKEGVEILSSIINKRYEEIEDIIYSNKGFISNFAGDAFIAIFPNVKNSGPIEVAFKIKKIFEEKGIEKTKYGNFELKIKIGISYGLIKWRIVGNNIRGVYYFRGDAIDNCVKSEHSCKSMDIVIDKNYYDIIQNKKIKLEKLNENFYKITDILSKHKQPQKVTKNEDKFFDYNIIRYFVPFNSYEILTVAELRYVFPIFINFEESSDEEKMNEIILDIALESDRYGGYFEEVLFGDKGSYILVLFGMPFFHENELDRAINFALSVKNRFCNKIRIGITTGVVYAGLEGGKKRSDYVALGDCVNLSARLMEKAAMGQILISEDIAKKVADKYHIAFLDCVQVKGKNELQRVFELLGFSRCKSINQNNDSGKIKSYEKSKSKVVGRDKELKFILDILTKLKDKKQYDLIYIYGEAGIGKTTFINEISIKVKSEISTILLRTDNILKTSLNPFSSFFEEYFDINLATTAEEKRAKFELIFEDLLKLLKDEDIIKEIRRTKSFLQAIVGIFEEGSLYSQLDPQSRYFNTILAIVEFFKALSSISPILFVIEDIHWLDEDSKEVIRYLIRNLKSYPVLFIATSRINDDGTMPSLYLDKDAKFTIIELKRLSDVDNRELIKSYLNYEVDDELYNFIIEKTEKIPFYIEQFCIYLLENNCLQLVDNRYSLKSKAIGLPVGINFIILARIDRLSYKLKETAKIASVIGSRFIVVILKYMMENIKLLSNVNEIESILEEGKIEKIWNDISEIEYIFSHALLREALYDMQLRTRLRELHKVAAQIIEQIYKDDPTKYIDIFYHYEKGEVKEKAIFYLHKTADYYKNNYKNKEALQLYDQLLDYDLNTEIKIDINYKKCEIFIIMGQWNAALSLIEESIKLCKRISDKLRECQFINLMANLLWRMADYDKALKIVKKAFEISKKIKDLIDYSTSLKIIGDIYYSKGKYDKALFYLKKSLNISKRLKNIKMVSDSYNSIGRIYDFNKDYKRALFYYKKSLKLAGEIDDKRGISIIYNNIAIVYYEKRDFNNALYFYQKSIEISEEIGDILGVSITYTNIGVIYYNIEDYQNAINYFEKSLKIQREIGAKGDFGYNLTYLACSYCKIGEYKKALENAYLHLQNIQDIKLDVEYGRTYLAIGLILAKYDNDEIISKISDITKIPKDARFYFEYAIKVSSEINYIETLVPALYEYALYLYEIGEKSTTIEKLNEAHKICKENNILDILEKIDKFMERISNEREKN